MLRVQERNDPLAFALLLKRWHGPVQQLCTRMTGDAHRGEDLAQETFTRLLAHARTYRHGARFSTFLWRIALNLCCDERRKAIRHPESPLDWQEEDVLGAECRQPPQDSPESLAARREAADLVREALLRLPEHYRAVLVLRHYEGLKFREIAAVLNIPDGTVKSRMAEALNRLRALLGPKLGGQGIEPDQPV